MSKEELKKKDTEFMKDYRGLPCAVCRKVVCLKDYNGKDILTVGHHNLEKSIYPEFRHEPMNMVPLCSLHHVPFAHEQKSFYQKWLYKNMRESWEWLNEHSRKPVEK